MSIVKHPYEEVNLRVDAAAVPAALDGVFAVSSTISFPMETIKGAEAFTNTAGTTHKVKITPSVGAWTAGSTVKIGISGYNTGTSGYEAGYCTVKVPSTGFANAAAANAAFVAAINARFSFVTAAINGAFTEISGAGAGSLDRGKPFIVTTYTDDPSRLIPVAVTGVGVAPLGTIAQVAALLPTESITVVHNLVKLKRVVIGDDGTSRKQLVNLWVDFSTTAGLAAAIVTALTIGDTSAADESYRAQIIAV
jgi:hypothetical protein